MHRSLGGGEGLSGDTVHWNIKRYLEKLLSEMKYEFDRQGPLHLDEGRVKEILQLA